MGDKVDNIPGVEGCGPKTAVKWLEKYGSLQGVMDHASEIKGKIGEKLAAALDHLPLSYELATIKCDVEVESDLDTFKLQEPNKDELIALYGECEFRRWLAELLDNPKDAETHLAVPTEATELPKVEDAHYETILTQAQFDTLIEQLNSAELFAFDTETTSLDYMKAQLVGSHALEVNTQLHPLLRQNSYPLIALSCNQGW